MKKEFCKVGQRVRVRYITPLGKLSKFVGTVSEIRGDREGVRVRSYSGTSGTWFSRQECTALKTKEKSAQETSAREWWLRFNKKTGIQDRCWDSKPSESEFQQDIVHVREVLPGEWVEVSKESKQISDAADPKQIAQVIRDVRAEEQHRCSRVIERYVAWMRQRPVGLSEANQQALQALSTKIRRGVE